MWHDRTLAVVLVVSGCSSGTPTMGPSSGSHAATSGASTTTSSGGPTGVTSGSTGGTSCPASSPVTWKENGESHCATFATADIGTNNVENTADGGRLVYTTLEVTVLQSAITDEFGFSVTSDADLTGSYTCVASPSSNVLFVDDDIGVYSTAQGTCNLAVSQTSSADGGIVVSGTFSAMLPVTDGGVQTITDGVFDLSATKIEN
jgi:hypothetical protein